jgi:hypothetical protein
MGRSPDQKVLACLKDLYLYFQKLILNWNKLEGIIRKGKEMGIQLDSTPDPYTPKKADDFVKAEQHR